MDEAPFLKRGDQAVHARFRLEVYGIPHFVERGRNAVPLHTVFDEFEQFQLFARQHESPE